MTILILTEEGELIAARDSMGRLPVLIGQREDGYCVSFESFAYHKLDYQDAYELGPRGDRPAERQGLPNTLPQESR